MGDFLEPTAAEWGEERAYRAASKACNLYSLSEPVLLRISHAAVYAAGEHIVRVEQRGRPVWSGSALVALTRHVASRGVRTAPPVFDLLPLTIDGLHVTFYNRVIDQSPMSDAKKAFLLGEQLRVLHENVGVEHVEALNMDDINLDYPSATIERSILSLKKIKELGSRSLSVEDIDYLLSETEEMGRKALEALAAHRAASEDPKVVIHGDSHLGNVLSVDDSIVLLDFEHSAVAEKFFDHVHMLFSDMVFETSNLYPSFSVGYEEDYSDVPSMEDWIRIVAVSYLIWTAAVGEYSVPHREEAQKRMLWWRKDPSAPKYWSEGF